MASQAVAKEAEKVSQKRKNEKVAYPNSKYDFKLIYFYGIFPNLLHLLGLWRNHLLTQLSVSLPSVTADGLLIGKNHENNSNPVGQSQMHMHIPGESAILAIYRVVDYILCTSICLLHCLQDLAWPSSILVDLGGP